MMSVLHLGTRALAGRETKEHDPGDAGMHACFCVVWWDEDGRIKLRKLPKGVPGRPI